MLLDTGQRSPSTKLLVTLTSSRLLVADGLSIALSFVFERIYKGLRPARIDRTLLDPRRR